MSVKLMSKVWEMDMKAVDKIILLAIADYADDEGVCWPRQSTIAAKTGVTRQTVNQKMKQMEQQNLLEKRDGKTILFPVREADNGVSEADSVECQAGRQESQAGRQEGRGDRHPSKPSTNHQLTVSESHSQAEVIYSEYPRHVGKGGPKGAIHSILKALKLVGFEKLLNRTKLYAQLTADKEKEFIPYPTTWYNQERYNDDPDEWMSSGTQVPVLEKLEHQLKYERDPEKWQAIKEKIQALKSK